MLSRLMTLFHEKVENRYYGKYRAIVTDNTDPEKRGRLKVKVPALAGDLEMGWAMPCVPYGGGNDTGFYMIPEVGDGVWVEFEAGQISHPLWTGTWWAGSEAPKGVENQDPHPDIKLIKTRSGNIIELNDTNGSITIQDKYGNKVMMGSSSFEIDSGSRDVTIKGNNITIEATGVLDLKGATINVESSGPVSIRGAVVDLN